MTNTNCLENIKCPACGNEESFRIAATTIATVTDDGTEDHGDMEWDDDSYAECTQCHRYGALKDFTVRSDPGAGGEAMRHIMEDQAAILREMREALERAEFLMRRVHEGDHHALENLPSAAAQARVALARAMAAPSPVAELLAALKGVLGESDYDAEGCCRGCGREREDEVYKYCAIDDDVEDCPFGFARAVIAKAGLAAAEHDHD